MKISLARYAGMAIVCALAVTAARAEDADGTLHVPAFVLPESSLLGEATRAHFKGARERRKADPTWANNCPDAQGADRAQMAAIRQCQADAFYRSSYYRRVRQRYPVLITAQEMGGVYTEVFTPAEGIARKNQNRVLINVHGGAFTRGSRTISHLESVPIASVGKIKVISIDYRLAPEYTFPSASEDVAAVYREVLKSYAPRNVGLFGCSAGGLLTAQAMAWFQKQGLPLPGAIGMLCEGAGYWTEGDSGYLGAALAGTGSPETAGQNPYFRDTEPNDPLVFPVRAPQLLARFPPSLLVAGTRDFALSSVAHTHSLLVAQGVTADLHVWEGLGHGFFFDPDLPQSREVHEVVIRFFDRHLRR